MQIKLQHVLFTTFAVAILTADTTPNLSAASAKNSAASTAIDTPRPEKREVRFPFRGKLARIDKERMTLAIEGKEKIRIVQLTAKTKMTKNGKPAKLEDASIGEEVGGLISRSDDGKEVAVSVRFGPKPSKTAKKPSPDAEEDEPGEEP